MNTKKLIGTILGVIAFALLVAGATYAWLTTNATVTGGNYSGTTRDFTFSYQGGSEVTGLKQISSGSATTSLITNAANASATTDGWIAVTASKAANTAKASHFYLKLNIATNTLATDSLMYAVCHGNCPTTTLATPANNAAGATCGSGVASCGTVAGGSTTEVVLLDDTNTFNVDGQVTTQTYNVYFWLNSTSMSDDDIGGTFTGSVVATATQGE